jgi:hypothetical protein
VDENAGEIPGGGITTHHDVGGVVLIKVGIEDRLASRFPHQSPKPAILPVVAQPLS